MDDSGRLAGPCPAYLHSLGLWRSRDSVSSTLRSWLCWATLVFMPLCAASKLLMDPPDDLVGLSMVSFVITGSTSNAIKATFFILQRRTIRSFVDLLVDMRKRYPGDERAHLLRENCQWHTVKLQRVLQVAMVSTSSSWIVSPILAVIFASPPINGTRVELQLPLPVWLPDNLQQSPYREFMFAAQSLSIITYMVATLSMISFFCSSMLMISIELKILNEKFAFLGRSVFSAIKYQHSGIELKESRNKALSLVTTRDKIFVTDSATEDINTGNETYTELVAIIEHHLAILKSIALLQEGMTYSIPVHLLTSITNVCLTVFVTLAVLQSGGSKATAFKTLCSVPHLLGVNAMFCLYGQTIIDQSEKLVSSAFNFDCIEADVRCGKMILIFMLVASRPLEITVVKTITVSKKTFVQILKGAYTLINLLYQFQMSED